MLGIEDGTFCVPDMLQTFPQTFALYIQRMLRGCGVVWCGVFIFILYISLEREKIYKYTTTHTHTHTVNILYHILSGPHAAIL